MLLLLHFPQKRQGLEQLPEGESSSPASYTVKRAPLFVNQVIEARGPLSLPLWGGLLPRSELRRIRHTVSQSVKEVTSWETEASQ